MADSIDSETQRLLERFGFDAVTFEKLRGSLRSPDADNVVRGRVEPPHTEDVQLLAPSRAPDVSARTAGEQALRRGDVAAVILAGGMATRFGGVVKAGVEVTDGKTFLDLKLLDARKVAERVGRRLSVFLMTSFATHDEVERLAQPWRDEHLEIRCFPQGISLRVRPDGELFRESDGSLSPYAPGHGDLTGCLRSSGILSTFQGSLLVMSNVDNLGATLDASVLGMHLASKVAVTAEVVRKEPGDRGGAPARVDGVPQIVEAFRFPTTFDQDTIPVFNTNTFVLTRDAIDRDFPLTWFTVRKKVDGREAVQFERLVGEITAHVPTRFLEVARTGIDGRFAPVKDPDELRQRRPEIVELLRARGVLAS